MLRFLGTVAAVLACLVIVAAVAYYTIYQDFRDRSEEAAAALTRAGYINVVLTKGAECPTAPSWGAFFTAELPALEKQRIQGIVCCSRSGCGIRI